MSQLVSQIASWLRAASSLVKRLVVKFLRDYVRRIVLGRALIVGGGIAGPVTAIALKKAGWEPVVYEAYERTADGVGATLDVGVNGIAALESIGLGDLIKGKSTDALRGAIHLGASGKKLVEFRRFDPELADGIVGQSVLRSDLYVALQDEAVRRGVTVEYRKRLAEAEGTAAGVRATFEDGSQAEGDLLIGADGLHSQVRRIIDPAAPAARYTRLLQIVGQVTGISVDAEPGVFNIVFGRRCLFCYEVHQDGRIWWLATPWRRTGPAPAQLAAITGEQWRTELLGLVRGDRTPAARLIEATPEIYRPLVIYHLPAVPTWHRDRMIIVGDAAHAASPASGQGASMAIEDAVTLAKCLRDVSGVERAFGEYERLRRERVEAIAAQGERNRHYFFPGKVGRILWDFFIAPRSARKFTATDLSWIWNYRIDWDERVMV